MLLTLLISLEHQALFVADLVAQGETTALQLAVAEAVDLPV